MRTAPIIYLRPVYDPRRDPLPVRLVTLLLSTACAVALLPAAPAHAALTFEVEVGRFFDESDHTAESMRFYPSSIRIASGDTLHFSTESFHGVTLLPAGVEAGDWAAENASAGGRWSAFVRDADEGRRGAKMNTRVASPSAACGWPGQSPCEFDGGGSAELGPLNSGVALFPSETGVETRELSFSVTVTADPGSTIFAVDPLHPAMTMRIEVVGSFAERSGLGELQDASDAQFAADAERAIALDDTYSRKRVKKVVKGKIVWQAWAGVEEAGVSLRRFYPAKLTVKRGHRVKWIFTKNLYEAHSVTFPRSRASSMAESFPEIACDGDGDDGTAPDSQPTSSEFPFCSSGDLEVDVPPAFVAASGDASVKSATDFESSGARGASFAPTKRAYQLAFPKKSPAAGFVYACPIHEAAHAPIQATVVVKR
jgi:plastocyanin